MPALTPEEWAALRGEWEAGTCSNLALAAKYNVSEKAIRKRSIAETWQRSPEALAAAQQAGTMRGLIAHDEAKREGGAKYAPPSDPAPVQNMRPPIVPPPREPDAAAQRSDPGSDPSESESDPPSDPTMSAQREAIATEVREISIDRVAEIMAAGTRDDLVRIDRLAETFDALHHHVMVLMGRGRGRVSEDEQDRMDQLLEALEGSKDTIAAKVTALARLAESIQTQRRKAVGMEDRPKRVELSGPDGGPIEQRVTTEEKALVLDFSKMSTADLQAYYRMAQLLEGKNERPPVPAPPGDPARDGAGDEEAAEA